MEELMKIHVGEELKNNEEQCEEGKRALALYYDKYHFPTLGSTMLHNSLALCFPLSHCSSLFFNSSLT
ncbi:hypothetical protein SESBI_21584 [Sesbania bispinosa]|nr:hypothetical protein SESBI_21584 [Sesbania bispinosa]